MHCTDNTIFGVFSTTAPDERNLLWDITNQVFAPRRSFLLLREPGRLIIAAGGARLVVQTTQPWTLLRLYIRRGTSQIFLAGTTNCPGIFMVPLATELPQMRFPEIDGASVYLYKPQPKPPMGYLFRATAGLTQTG